MAPELEERYRRNASLDSRAIGSEVILSRTGGRAHGEKRVYRLEKNGACVWELVDGERSVAEIRDEIVERFDAGKDEVEQEVVELLAELEEVGLVETV